MNQDTAQATTRTSRGLDLYRAGHVRDDGNGRYMVLSSNSRTAYSVDTERGRCDCPDSAELCKHLAAAFIFQAKSRRHDTARPKTGTRHGKTSKPRNAWGFSFTNEQIAENLARMEG